MAPKPGAVAEVVAVPKEKIDVVAPKAGWLLLLVPKEVNGPLPPKGACVVLPKAGWVAGWATDPAKLKLAPKLGGPPGPGLLAAC